MSGEPVPLPDAERLLHAISCFVTSAILHPAGVDDVATAALFTAGVEQLRTTFPNGRIRAVMRVVWDLVEHKIVGVGRDPRLNIPSLHFLARYAEERRDGVIYVPEGWATMVAANPVFQLAGLVYVGSHAVDFYHDRPGPSFCTFAKIREAELLRTVRALMPAWKPTDYQRAVLATHPLGLDSPEAAALAYDLREVALA